MRLLLHALIAVEAGALFGLTRVDPRTSIAPVLGLFALALAAAGGAFLVQRRRPIRLRHIVALALLLRLPLIFTTPTLSDDVWRYLHDGRAAAAGVSPYAHAPADPATAAFRGPEHPLINHPSLVTIYPPGAQVAFLANALAGASLAGWKLLLLIAELALILLLAALIRARGRPIGYAALYAWHPLAAIEIAGNAHLEPLAIAPMLAALLLAARARGAAAGLALGYSVAVKFWALPLLPFVCRDAAAAGREHGTAPARTLCLTTIAAATAAVALLYAPFIGTANPFGSAGVFAATWASNAAAFPVLQVALGSRTTAAVMAALVLGMLLLRQWRRGDRAEDAAWTLVFATLLLAPVVHPWYLLWLLALLPLRPQGSAATRAALWWTAAVPAAYAVLPAYAATGVWAVPPWALLLQYGPLVALLAARRAAAVPGEPPAPATNSATPDAR
jgi:hypothetical protein